MDVYNKTYGTGKYNQTYMALAFVIKAETPKLAGEIGVRFAEEIAELEKKFPEISGEISLADSISAFQNAIDMAETENPIHDR